MVYVINFGSLVDRGFTYFTLVHLISMAYVIDFGSLVLNGLYTLFWFTLLTCVTNLVRFTYLTRFTVIARFNLYKWC